MISHFITKNINNLKIASSFNIHFPISEYPQERKNTQNFHHILPKLEMEEKG